MTASIIPLSRPPSQGATGGTAPPEGPPPDTGPPRAEATPKLDQRFRGIFGSLVGGQSPWAALQAVEDWAFHLALSPGRQAELWQQAFDSALALGRQALVGPDPDGPPFKPDPADRRFRDPGWTVPPFSLLAQAQLAMEAQWRAATSGIHGVEAHHARRVEFLGRFALNAFAPVNFPWSNPAVVMEAWRTAGMNFVDGGILLAEDILRLSRGERLKELDSFRVGEVVAATPGQVVFRNELIELIQYTPTTASVRAEPILIVPAWIMKYYILDLAPERSLVRYLVDQGFTVFMISWRNPGPEQRDTTLEDYRCQGVMKALEAVGHIVPKARIHAVGYCLGGTVLAIAAAAMDRDGDERLASLSLFAAQTDFEEAGELMMFIDESQLALLEDMMSVRGYLDARQMAGAFYALRANEMVFAKMVERYLMGWPVAPTDLDAWLTDPTRMPARMHGEYLRGLFLENRFAHGSYQVGGRAVALKDIRTPIFALGAERDHIAPWRSVYKIELYGSADTTFVLTGGGHNTSVVTPPGKEGAYYRISTSRACGDYLDPDIWLTTAPKLDGSWWPFWTGWLDARSSAGRRAPPTTGNPGKGLKPLCAAPGQYVMES